MIAYEYTIQSIHGMHIRAGSTDVLGDVITFLWE